MTIYNKYLMEKWPFLQNIFNAIQNGIIFLDLNFTVVQANQWMEKKYGSKMPLIGKKCYDVFHSRQTPCDECPYIAILETGLPQLEVLSYPCPEGHTECFEISLFRLEDLDGNVIGAIGDIKDITEHRKTEDFLRNEVIRQRNLVEQSRDGIVVLDQDGKVYEANQQYANMLGYSMEEVRELHVWDWDTQWTKKELLEMIRTVDEKGDHFETSHRRKDGTLCDVEISTNGAIYLGQKLILCVCRDITERKKSEKDRERLIKELQDALKEIKTLRGILPLCSYCKKIRDDKGYWEQVDVYIGKHSQADISHSICPECMKKYYPDITDHEIE
jgi:PAS domain S-box-containing protein